MQNDNTIIELVDVHKYFGANEVLKGVNLTVKQGEFISIRGKSGVGKTNLFKIIGLLETPCQGTVNIFGKDTSTLNDDKKTELRLKQIGLVFQFFNLLPSLTVLENIELPMALNGIKKQQRIERANELLKFFGLTTLAERFPGNLSGGEKRMVLIARAIAQEAEMLLMDEPMTFLDLHHQAALMETIMGLNSAGKTIFMISHGINLASEYVKRVVLMKDGAIRADGTPGNVITQENMKNIFSMENFYIESNKLSKRPNVFIVPGIPDGLSGPDGV